MLAWEFYHEERGTRCQRAPNLVTYRNLRFSSTLWTFSFARMIRSATIVQATVRRAIITSNARHIEVRRWGGVRNVSWKGYNELKSRPRVKEEERKKNINETKANVGYLWLGKF